jgi:hypothetical protein
MHRIDTPIKTSSLRSRSLRSHRDRSLYAGWTPSRSLCRLDAATLAPGGARRYGRGAPQPPTAEKPTFCAGGAPRPPAVPGLAAPQQAKAAGAACRPAAAPCRSLLGQRCALLRAPLSRPIVRPWAGAGYGADFDASYPPRSPLMPLVEGGGLAVDNSPLPSCFAVAILK